MKQFFKKIITFIIQYEARLVLNKYKPKVVLVVGSVGKTTTKDSIYTVLKNEFFVRKSEKSFNSEIGVPLTILGLENAWTSPWHWLKNIFEGAVLVLLKNKYPEWLVLEVGADHPGDIKSLASWIKSDVVVITRLPEVPVHVEFFENPAQVVEEKVSAIDTLKKDGKLVLNLDDEIISRVRERFSEREIITFGTGKDHDVWSSHAGIISKNKKPQGERFHLRVGESDLPIELYGVLGKQHIYPTLAGVAVGVALGVELEKIHTAFLDHVPPSGRMRIIDGLKETTIIDDTYNSSPVALEEALNVMEKLNIDGRKIAVLGDMLELGKYSIEEHKKAGKKVAEICDVLLTVGFRARGIAEGALQNRMHGSKVYQYDDVMRAGKELEHFIEKGDVILVKGSQGVRLEKVVEEIMNKPQDKNKLLVRQDEAWSNR